MTNNQSRPKLLIHIGYHKTASTFWQENIFNDERINLIPREEIREQLLMKSPYAFDSKIFNDWLASKLSTEHLTVISEEELSGNIHTSGGGRSITYETIERLAQIDVADVYILIFIRNQATMIDSCYRQYVKKGGCFSFKNYIYSERKGSLRYRFPGFSFEHLKYDDVITHCLSRFSKEKVFTFPYERFVNEPGAVVGRISESLAVALSINEQTGRKDVNRSYSNFTILLARLTNRLFNLDPIGRHSIFGFNALYYGLRKLYMVLDGLLPRRWFYRSYVNESLRKEIVEYYRATNEKIEKICGISLNEYEYYGD